MSTPQIAALARGVTVSISPDRTIREAAEVMERRSVGALAVVDGDRLTGIVTDRDIVRRAVARGLPMDGRIDAVMTTDVVTIDADADHSAAYALFHAHAVRRLPIVRDGRFVGMITIDDLLVEIAGHLADLARPVIAEVLFGHHDPAPVEVASAT